MSTQRFPFVLEDAFHLTHGTALAPGVPIESAPVRVGQEIELPLSSGDRWRTTIRALEKIDPNLPKTTPVLIAKDVDSRWLVPGTEVWPG